MTTKIIAVTMELEVPENFDSFEFCDLLQENGYDVLNYGEEDVEE